MNTLFETETFEFSETINPFSTEIPAPAISALCATFIRRGELLANFAFDSSTLTAAHRAQINRAAQCIVDSRLTNTPIRQLRVIGHTDPVGREAYNQQLSLRRAQAVRNALIAAVNQLRPGLGATLTVLVKGCGESDPAPGNAEASRRVELFAIPPPFVTSRCAPHRSRVRLHLKILVPPTRFTIDQMLAAMRQVYGPRGFLVEVASRETLNLPDLEELDVFCPGNPALTCCPFPCASNNLNPEHVALFNNRRNVGANELAVYFVRRTDPGLNGCCAHPPGRPGAVVTANASQWSLAHEIGHVLGLRHINCLNRLMTGLGTNNITNPPPELIPDEVETMENSAFTITC